MEFIKEFLKEQRKKNKFGSVVLKDGKITVRMYQKGFVIDKVGLIKDGIGCTMKQSDKDRASVLSMKIIDYDKEDIPVNLQVSNYRFKIPAIRVSESPSFEYAFMFKDVKML